MASISAPRQTDSHGRRMNPQTREEYDGTRNLANKAVLAICYAAHTNLYFDQFGFVRACCWNKEHVLGNARTQSIDEIWRGAQAQLLRDALERYDLGLGCRLCEAQVRDGWLTRATMRNFDQFAVAESAPAWPKRMEFSISNTCNLECIMCNGFFSSSIRAKRERLPPVEKIYSDAFIESLRPYLRHLTQAKFLGGEPMLINQYYRIWEMMVEDSLTIGCHLTTNGTVLSRKFERIMLALPMSFAVSLDGASKETVESIRVNASYDEQMRILKRLREYTRERKTDLSLTFCFMRMNWHELGEFCLFADDWGCHVGVNTVVHPPQFGVYTLPLEELCKVRAGMEAQLPRLESALNKNRRVWFAELERVRLRCESLASSAGATAGRHEQPQPRVEQAD
jgi:MoaA/NifB/PqqE/SkfB family radical SAM enzyme